MKSQLWPRVVILLIMLITMGSVFAMWVFVKFIH